MPRSAACRWPRPHAGPPSCAPHNPPSTRPPTRFIERVDAHSLMATHLDLEEQEQLDQLKSFWKQYGNLITWVLIVVLGAYAAWNGWNWYQRDQAVKSGAMFDELDKAAQAGDADSAGRIFND